MSLHHSGRDRAVIAIVLTNAGALIMAVVLDWSALQLMWPFWLQSVIIGWYARQRMLRLTDFCTEGMKMNGRSLPPTPQSLRSAANFFALHYGGFHVGYLVFLVAMSTTADAAGYVMVTNESTGERSPVYIGHVDAFDFVVYALLAAGFWHTHRASHREHVAADLGGRPKLGTLMMVPYARVLPMHLTIILAFALGGGMVWLFVVLKTAADVAMHKAEHAWLRGSGAENASPAAVPGRQPQGLRSKAGTMRS
jgi:hypothetical protein